MTRGGEEGYGGTPSRLVHDGQPTGAVNALAGLELAVENLGRQFNRVGEPNVTWLADVTGQGTACRSSAWSALGVLVLLAGEANAGGDDVHGQPYLG